MKNKARLQRIVSVRGTGNLSTWCLIQSGGIVMELVHVYLPLSQPKHCKPSIPEIPFPTKIAQHKCLWGHFRVLGVLDLFQQTEPLGISPKSAKSISLATRTIPENKPLCFSPPVRWGLLDFMSDTSPLPPLPLPSSPSSSSSAILCDQCSAPDLNGESARSVCRAGPQLRVCEISVPRRTSTASLRGQCSAPDLNRESARSVLRAGPQPRVCEISVACRTSTASLRDQCCVPDLNRESARSVLRAGPQLDPASSVLWQDHNRRYVRKICQKEFQKICPKECQKICQKECQKICQKEWQQICQKECQKECQKICQKECQKICQKECQQICQKECQNECIMSERMSERTQKICQKDCQEICQK